MRTWQAYWLFTVLGNLSALTGRTDPLRLGYINANQTAGLAMKWKGRVLTMVSHATADLDGTAKATRTACIPNITHENFPFLMCLAQNVLEILRPVWG